MWNEGRNKNGGSTRSISTPRISPIRGRRSGYTLRDISRRVNSFSNCNYRLSAHQICVDPSAIPLLLLHGWPGSFIEFNSAFKLLRESTSPSFSVIVPSQFGYGFSDDPPLDEDLKMIDIARQMNTLMLGLGFKRFVVQGGDIGSVIARLMAVHHDAVQSININYMPLAGRIEGLEDNSKSFVELSDVERRNVEKAQVFASTGRGYGVMQGTRPSTISFVVQSSPVALLAWCTSLCHSARTC